MLFFFTKITVGSIYYAILRFLDWGGSTKFLSSNKGVIRKTVQYHNGRLIALFNYATLSLQFSKDTKLGAEGLFKMSGCFKWGDFMLIFCVWLRPLDIGMRSGRFLLLFDSIIMVFIRSSSTKTGNCLIFWKIQVYSNFIVSRKQTSCVKSLCPLNNCSLGWRKTIHISDSKIKQKFVK